METTIDSSVWLATSSTRALAEFSYVTISLIAVFVELMNRANAVGASLQKGQSDLLKSVPV